MIFYRKSLKLTKNYRQKLIAPNGLKIVYIYETVLNLKSQWISIYELIQMFIRNKTFDH